MMKKCSRCKEVKDGNDFGKRASSKDGLDSRCLDCIKECSKQSANKNKAKNSSNVVSSKLCPTCRVEKTADCFGTNPSSKDGLRNECKDCRNIKTRYKYETDLDFRESESIRAALNYLEDREYILNRSKRWSKENPDKKVEQRHRRQARLYGQIDFDLPIDFIKTLREEQKNKCAYCSRDDIKLTVEHMLPISRSGKHCMANIVLACTTCNFSKHNKTLEEWLAHNQKLQKLGIMSNMITIICDNLKSLLAVNSMEIE
jgi:HNH endonuclease